MELRGKKVFVTGGAIRVGAAVVRAFAHAGAFVTIHCRRSEEAADALLAELGGTRAGHSVCVRDLAETNAAEQLAPALEGVSVLVNNASVFNRKEPLSETAEEAAAQFAVNFTAPVELMKVFARVCAKGALIVNMLDQGIARPDGAAFSYALSKKALAEATKAAALAFAPEIRVNGIAPGPMIPPPDLPFSRMGKTIPRLPLKRAVAPEDVASTCLFLAENESMTGAVVFVDCGLSLT